MQIPESSKTLIWCKWLQWQTFITLTYNWCGAKPPLPVWASFMAFWVITSTFYSQQGLLPDTAHNPVAAFPKCVVTWSYCTVPDKAGRDVLYQKVKIGLRATRLVKVENKSLTNWDKVVNKSWMNHKKEQTSWGWTGPSSAQAGIGLYFNLFKSNG